MCPFLLIINKTLEALLVIFWISWLFTSPQKASIPWTFMSCPFYNLQGRPPMSKELDIMKQYKQLSEVTDGSVK